MTLSQMTVVVNGDPKPSLRIHLLAQAVDFVA
jgi:hypothetical protein